MPTLFYKGEGPFNEELPYIDETEVSEVNTVLICVPGVWRGASFLGYQWVRNGLAVEGATSTIYTVTMADSESDLHCEETADGKVTVATNSVSVLELTEDTGVMGDLRTFQLEIDIVDDTKTLVGVIDESYEPLEYSYAAATLEDPDDLVITAGSSLGLQYGAGALMEEMGFRWYTPREEFTVRPPSIPTNLVLPKTQEWYPHGVRLSLTYGHVWTPPRAASFTLLNNAWNKWSILNRTSVVLFPSGHRWAAIINANQDFFAVNGHMLEGALGTAAGTHFKLQGMAPSDRTKLAKLCAAELLSFTGQPAVSPLGHTAMDASDGDVNPPDLFYPFTAEVGFWYRNGVDPPVEDSHHPPRQGRPNGLVGAYGYGGHRRPPTEPYDNVYMQVAIGFSTGGFLTFEELVAAHAEKATAGVQVRDYWDTQQWSRSLPMAMMKKDSLARYVSFKESGATTVQTEFQGSWLVNVVWTRYALRWTRTGTYTYDDALDEVMADIFDDDPAVRSLYNLWSNPGTFNVVTEFQTFSYVNSMVPGWYKTLFQMYCVVIYKMQRLPKQRLRVLKWPHWTNTNYEVGAQVQGVYTGYIWVTGEAVSRERRFYRLKAKPPSANVVKISTVMPSHTYIESANEITGPDGYRWKNIDDTITNELSADYPPPGMGWMFDRNYFIASTIVNTSGHFYRCTLDPGTVFAKDMPTHIGSFDQPTSDGYVWRDITDHPHATRLEADPKKAEFIIPDYVTNAVYAPRQRVRNPVNGRLYRCITQPGGSTASPIHIQFDTQTAADGYVWENIMDTSDPDDPFPAAVISLGKNIVAMRDLDIIHSYAFCRNSLRGPLFNNYNYLNFFYGHPAQKPNPEPEWLANPVLPTVEEFNAIFGIVDDAFDRDPRLDEMELSLVSLVPNVPPSTIRGAGTGFGIKEGTGNFLFRGPGQVTIINNHTDAVTVMNFEGADDAIHLFTVAGPKNVGASVRRTSETGRLFLDTFPSAPLMPLSGFGAQEHWLFVPTSAHTPVPKVNLEGGPRIRFYANSHVTEENEDGKYELFPKTDLLNYTPPTTLGPGQVRVDNPNSVGKLVNINCNRWLSCHPYEALIPTSIAEDEELIDRIPENVELPTIGGEPKNGGAMFINLGLWLGDPTPVFTYQWKNTGVAIPGATGATYVGQPSDAEDIVTCDVTGTNIHGSDTVTTVGVTVSGTPTNLFEVAHDGTATGLTALGTQAIPEVPPSPEDPDGTPAVPANLTTFGTNQPDPDSGTTAISLTCAVGPVFSGVSKAVTFYNGINYIQFKVKKDPLNWPQAEAWVRVRILNTSLVPTMSINLNNGVIGSNQFTDAAVVPLTDGWWGVSMRCNMAGMADLAGSIQLHMANANGSSSLGGLVNRDHVMFLNDFIVSR